MNNTWLGGEYQNVIISSKNFDEEIKKKVDTEKGILINFYIRVYPHVMADKLDKESKGIPYSFNIAFYDEESTV